MPANDSPAFVIARYLKTNNYEKTLEAFIAEANLPPDAGALTSRNALTLETVLEEKRAFDMSLRYRKGGEDDEADADKGWASSPTPGVPTVVRSLPTSANLLYVGVHDVFVNGGVRRCIVASSADRRVELLSAEGGGENGFEYLESLITTDSPVLSCVFLDAERVIVTAMSGLVVLRNLRTLKSSERRDHKKYVVKAAIWPSSDGSWLATAGWDARVLLYRVTGDELGEAIAEINLQTNPESIVFAKNPDTERLFLIISRRDSSSIYYHLINEAASQAQDAASAASSILTLVGTQNLAPHSNAWVAFSPASMALSPTDPSLLAVATSSLPHMKVIIVRLLFPSAESIDHQPVYATQAAQGRASLERQNREETAIQIQISTMAPQTPYSTPQIHWRPNGSGVFTNGDDGAIRGVESKTGKIISILKDGHEIGSKIRSLWAGRVGSDGEEWLVSGGFDRRLVVWKPE